MALTSVISLLFAHLNEVLSIRAQEYHRRRDSPAERLRDLNEVLSIRAQEYAQDQLDKLTGQTSMKS